MAELSVVFSNFFCNCLRISCLTQKHSFPIGEPLADGRGICREHVHTAGDGVIHFVGDHALRFSARSEDAKVEMRAPDAVRELPERHARHEGDVVHLLPLGEGAYLPVRLPRTYQRELDVRVDRLQNGRGLNDVLHSLERDVRAVEEHVEPVGIFWGLLGEEEVCPRSQVDHPHPLRFQLKSADEEFPVCLGIQQHVVRHMAAHIVHCVQEPCVRVHPGDFPAVIHQRVAERDERIEHQLPARETREHPRERHEVVPGEGHEHHVRLPSILSKLPEKIAILPEKPLFPRVALEHLRAVLLHCTAHIPVARRFLVVVAEGDHSIFHRESNGRWRMAIVG